MAHKKIRFFAPFVGSGLESWIGGGPIRFFELIRYLLKSEQFSITLATTSGGKQMLTDYFQQDDLLGQIDFVAVPASLFLRKQPFALYKIWSYLLSFSFLILYALFMKKQDVGFCPSDFFFHLKPLRFMKRIKKIDKFYSVIYHRIPSPESRKGSRLLNNLSYLQQQNMFKLLNRYADGLMISDTLEGHEIGQYFKKNMAYQGRIIYVKMGVQWDVIDAASESSEKFDVIHVGIRPNKGVFDIPEIWSKFREKNPGATLGLIGGASDSIIKQLNTEFKKSGTNDSIRFLGFVDECKKFSLIKSASLFIAPSHEEGWGIAVGEALACGTPVVGYELKAYVTAFQDTIRYVACYNKKEFAQGMIDVFKTKTQQNELSKKGMKYMKQYHWSKLFDEEIEILSENIE